jgi:hypothetical protein
MKVANTSEQFFQLLRAGKTLDAIEQFYDDNAEQTENAETAIKGKTVLRKREQENISRVKWFSIEIPGYVVNEQAGSVMGEMRIKFENTEGRQKLLEQTFVQKWKNGKLTEQRFYYNAIIDASRTTEQNL